MMVLPPSENTICFGHDSFFMTVQQTATQGRFPHAWLLCGPQGVGKRTAAYVLIRQFFAQGRHLTAEDPLFRRIAVESHGDFFALKGTQIDSIRELSRFLQKAPVEGELRIALLPNADRLTMSASNALLKILEEPAASTLFFLTAQNQGAVLPTLRSRCRLERLFPSSKRDFFPYLQELCKLQGLPYPEQETLWELSQGCLGKALNLIIEKTIENTTFLTELIEKALVGEKNAEFQPPFHSRNMSFWNAVSKEWLEENLITWLQNLIVRSVQETALSVREQAIFSQKDILAWGRIYENLNHFLAEARTFNLDTLQIAVTAFAILQDKK